MAYLFSKICAILLIATFAAAQIASPDSTWTDYKIKSCCPTGYNEVGNYCVKCTAPLFFDAISGKCNGCPTGHYYNAASARCDCEQTCAAPRVVNTTTKACECSSDSKGLRLTYNSTLADPKTGVVGICVCPDDLPLWNGKYCVACPANTHYDPKEQQCYYCPDGFIRDTASHTCVPGL
jgi:hypothetical protein